MSRRSPRGGSWKWAVSRAGLVLLGLAPLLLLEAALRLFPVPGDPAGSPRGTAAVIDPFERSGDWLVTRREYQPAVRPARFAAAKPPGTLRVFCLGGSSTFGYPYEDAALAWPAFLERRLRRTYPGVRVEVVNLGGNSYGTSRNLGTLPAALAHGADVVVLLAGSNEFIEDSYRPRFDGAGGLVDAIRSLRTYRALERLLEPKRAAPTIGAGPAGGTGDLFFPPVVSGDLYPPASPERREVLERLAGNLDRMAELARRAEVTLVFAAQPSNLRDWAPEPDRAAPPDPAVARRWRSSFDRARALEKAGSLTEAAAAYEETQRLWPESAEACFRHGRVLLALGRAAEARRLLVRARDLDAAPVRPTTAIREAIAAAARRHGLPFADLEQPFEAASPQGTIGDELILDFVHPTPRGSALIAREIWRTLAGTGSPWSGYHGEGVAASDRADAEKAAQETALRPDLAFTWGQIYERKGMPVQAVAMYRKAIEQGSPLPYPRQNLAVLLLNEGQPQLALPLLEEIVARWPDFREARPVLARVYRALGNDTAAAREFSRSLEAGTADADTFRLHAQLLIDMRSPAEAEAVLARGLAANPGDCEMEAIRGLALEAGGDWQGARGSLEATLRRDPGCHPAWQNLGALQMQRGELTAAVETFRRALGQPSPWPEHRLNLGYAYRALHRPAEATAEFAAYCREVPDCASRVPPEFLGSALPAGGRARR